MLLLRRLLWVDCTAGALVGVLVLAFSGWLDGLYGLPRWFLLFMGAANLVYASYSFSLARQPLRPGELITLLAVANVAWGALCAWWAVSFADSAAWLGVGHLALESLFVGGLGVLEWRHRDVLLTAA